MLAPDETRYEFRVFGEGIAHAREVLSALAAGTEQPISRETYIVTRLNIESNVKIRSGQLQVKTLCARFGILDQWARPLNAEFPVPVAEVENIVLPALGLDVEIGEKGALGEGALLAFVGAQHPLAVIEVAKRRTLYELGAAVAEFTTLHIGDEELKTFAVECVDADAAIDIVQKAGLGEAQNDSYSEFLQRRLFDV